MWWTDTLVQVKWQIMVVESVLGAATTLPPYMVTMQTDDLMRDYLQSRVTHYVHLLKEATLRSSVRATIGPDLPLPMTTSNPLV